MLLVGLAYRDSASGYLKLCLAVFVGLAKITLLCYGIVIDLIFVSHSMTSFDCHVFEDFCAPKKQIYNIDLHGISLTVKTHTNRMLEPLCHFSNHPNKKDYRLNNCIYTSVVFNKQPLSYEMANCVIGTH